MDALIVTLTAWIAAHSNLAAAPAPRIQFIAKQEMTSAYQGAAHARGFFHVEAFYQPATATIYLPQDWNAAGLRDESVLVHELVHHLQAANKVRVGCPAALERQAYALQIDWLREQGITDPYDFAGLDILAVIIAGSCPE
jgi:hypothetical protein